MNPYGSTRVDGEGPTPCDLMFVGEGPGADEDKWGRPFVGKSGRELNRYIWNSITRIRTSVFVTNLVRYRVPNDGDPTPEDIERDRAALELEISAVGPEVIITLGRWSTRYFLGDVDMETVHGIPHWANNRAIMPVIHPAAGLHSTEFQGAIAWDFEQLGKLLRGDTVQWAAEDEHPKPYYEEHDRHGKLDVRFIKTAIDTEGSVARPWCLSFSCAPGFGTVARRGPGQFTDIILHNALHDIGVLRALGVEYESFDDTMIMAYLLCVEPQGLKALAKRHCGMEMSDYSELVAKPNRFHAHEYLNQVIEWLNKRLNNESHESLRTPSRSRKRTSVKGGRKSSRTASRKKSSRR